MYHLHFCPCCHVITHASCVMIHNVKGRRMGGNNISAQERICAQCQGKVAHFEIVRIKGFNFYKKTTSTHTHPYTLFLQLNYTHPLLLLPLITHCIVGHLNYTLCILVQLHYGITVYNSKVCLCET